MKKRNWIALALIAALAGGAFTVFEVRESMARAAELEALTLRRLTDEQVVMLLKNQELVEGSKTFAVVATEESRKSFLSGLREYLALAARARKEGLADEPDIRRILAYKSDNLLFTLYQNKLDNDKGSYFELPEAEIRAFLADDRNASEYAADMNAIRNVQRSVARNTGNPIPGGTVGEGEAAEKAKLAWAKSKIISQMARSDGEFISDPAVQLRLKVAEAGVLATNYLNKYFAPKIKPTESEISAFLAAHPEYQPAAKKTRAEEVLRRVKAGEDFSALAKEFSEDRSNKSQGGLYKQVAPGFLWPQVERAAAALQPGEVADQLIESKDGWHIVGLAARTTRKNPDGSFVSLIDVRHILFQRRFEEPGIRIDGVPPPFLTPREIAEGEIRKSKRRAFVDEVIASEAISLPDDFYYEITDNLRNSGVRLENQLQAIEQEEREARRSSGH